MVFCAKIFQKKCLKIQNTNLNLNFISLIVSLSMDNLHFGNFSKKSANISGHLLAKYIKSGRGHKVMIN